MALIKISQLPPGDSDLSPNDVVPFVDAETQTTKKVSVQGLSDYFDAQGIGSHDSALTQGQIDSSFASYQFDYFEYDSAVVQGQIDSSLSGFSGYDSALTQGQIDSSLSEFSGYDSALTQGQIDSSLASGGYLQNIVEDSSPQLGGELDANGHDIVNLDFLRLNTDGSGLRMTNVGAFDNTGGSTAGNFRVFASNDLILGAGGNDTAVRIDKTTKDATFAGTITVHNAYTLPESDGTVNQYLKTDGAGNISFADGMDASPTSGSSDDF